MKCRLSKVEEELHQSLIERLRALRGMYAQQVNKQPTLTEYIAVLGEAREHVESCASYWREQWDEKSENWQDGDRGQEVNDFIETWESVELSEPDPNDLMQDLDDDAAELENLETSI